MATPDKRFIVSVFEATADRCPDNVAVEHDGAATTYSTLKSYVNAIATTAQDAGVGRNVIVGTCLEPGVEYVAAFLGILKAGGIVLPLDLAFPPGRIDAILKRTPPAMVVGRRDDHIRLAERVGDLGKTGVRTGVMDGCATLSMEPGADSSGLPRSSASENGPENELEQAQSPDDGCYLMYTSGSTGEPKAILGCHKSLSHFMHWEAREFELDDSLRVSQFAPLTFDASLRDLLLPLVTGGRVCIPRLQDRTNPRQLIEWLQQSAVNLIHCVPSFFRVLTGELEQREGAALLPNLKRILMAGEALYGKDVHRWMDLVGDRVELVNLYGCSETTLIKTFHRIRERPVSPGSIIPIGKPISNTALLLVRGGRLCDIGEIGDIYINTPFASKGYYQDPTLTAARFVPNPLDPDGDGVVYKTGDIGRYLPDRAVEFIGRLDNQVKLNGIRVEIGEVELAVTGYADVDQSVVVALPGPYNEKSLTCYYTDKRPTSADDIRRHLATVLPEFMIPAFFVRLEQFPLNINGKIDRKALPKPEEILYEQVFYEAPTTTVERKVAEIWAEVLGLKKVGVNNTFGELGGHSLQAIRIISRMFRAFDVEMSILAFFENPTVRKQARRLDQEARTDYQAIPPVEPQPTYALSHAQRRLWVLGQIESGLTAYNITHAALLEGELDRGAMRSAFEALIARHESLRTVFVAEAGQPRQRAVDAMALSMEEVDLSDRDDDGTLLGELLNRDKRARLDLSRGPLFRATLVRVRCDRHVLIVTTHHIISDGWSMGVLQEELLALYEAFRSNSDNPLPALAIQYKDFAAWQNARLEAVAARNSDYWLDKLSGEIRGLDLRADAARPALFSYRGRTTRFHIDSDLAASIKRLAEREGATLFMALVAAVKILLLRYTGEPDLLVGTPVAGRDHPDLERQIGFYAQTLVLRDHLCGSDSYLQTLKTVRRTCLDAYEHRDYPFDLLVDGLDIERDPSRNPIFDVMVVLQEGADESPVPGPLTVSEIEIEEETSRFDLTLNFSVVDGELRVDINYASDLFGADRIARLATHLETLFRSIVQEPGRPVRELEIIPERERQLVLSAFGRGKTHARDGSSIVDVFEQQVRKTPDQPALVGADGELSYGELNERADRVAGFLRECCAVSPGHLVGSIVERGEWNIVGLLGILKCGATYLPLDPGYPDHRLAYMLDDSGCRVVLAGAQEEGRDHATLGGRTVERVEIRGACRRGPALERIERNSAAAAYVIYTSGSTGQPKGVAVEHDGFVNMSLAQVDGFGVTAHDRVLQFFSPSFDGSLSEVFMALFAGATLVPVATDVIMDVERFRAFLHENQVSVASLSPSFLARLQRRGLESLRILITAGEPAFVDDALWYSKRLKYFNAYGPTECSVCAAYHQVGTDDCSRPTAVPIGKPIANMAIYVLDDALAPVPIGVPGEIYIAGPGVAAGYLNRPTLTARRFLPDPFSRDGRMYRSGDVGRWLANGELEFLGRIDSQVKIRGHRIECAEVEHWIVQHEDVAHAAVVARDIGESGPQLVAYFVSDQNVEAASLRTQLKARVPDFMIPSIFRRVAQIPVSPSGKIDRRRLPTPETRGTGSPAGQAPRNDVERQLVEVWGRVLGRVPGIDENFFEIGGHSLRAMEVADELRRTMDAHTQLTDLYQAPTIRELARVILRADAADQASQPYLEFNDDADRSLFAFPAVADADSLVYEGLARQLRDARIHAFRYVDRQDLITHFADVISESRRNGPYVLLGYSAGGNLAFRVARELRQRGAEVSDVLLLDAYRRDQLENLTPEQKLARVELELNHHQVAGNVNGKPASAQFRQTLESYIRYLSETQDEGVIDANIHLIKAADNLDAQEARKWARATARDFREYCGAGTHYHMLSGEHLKHNARIIRDILAPRARG